jgi:hypothetical protein
MFDATNDAVPQGRVNVALGIRISAAIRAGVMHYRVRRLAKQLGNFIAEQLRCGGVFKDYLSLAIDAMHSLAD